MPPVADSIRLQSSYGRVRFGEGPSSSAGRAAAIALVVGRSRRNTRGALLLRRDQDGDRRRAASIIEAMLATQMHQPAWDRGRFPMAVPETWRDLNANLFLPRRTWSRSTTTG